MFWFKEPEIELLALLPQLRIDVKNMVYQSFGHLMFRTSEEYVYDGQEKVGLGK